MHLLQRSQPGTRLANAIALDEQPVAFSAAYVRRKPVLNDLNGFREVCLGQTTHWLGCCGPRHNPALAEALVRSFEWLQENSFAQPAPRPGRCRLRLHPV